MGLNVTRGNSKLSQTSFIANGLYRREGYKVTGDASSIYSILVHARENARTTREILPSEVWEKTNELYLRAAESTGSTTTRLPQTTSTSMSDNFAALVSKMSTFR